MSDARLWRFAVGTLVGLGIARGIPEAIADCDDPEQRWAFEQPSIEGPPDGWTVGVWSDEVRVITQGDEIEIWTYEDFDIGSPILTAERPAP